MIERVHLSSEELISKTMGESSVAESLTRNWHVQPLPILRKTQNHTFCRGIETPTVLTKHVRWALSIDDMPNTRKQSPSRRRASLNSTSRRRPPGSDSLITAPTRNRSDPSLELPELTRHKSWNSYLSTGNGEHDDVQQNSSKRWNSTADGASRRVNQLTKEEKQELRQRRTAASSAAPVAPQRKKSEDIARATEELRNRVNEGN